MIYKVKVTVSS